MWQSGLRGDAGYRLFVRLILDEGEPIAGVCYELYPHSRCGLVTYLVVAPAARGRGIGRQLFEGAARELYALGARAVFGEVSDPAVHGESARQRIERFLRWGAQLVDVPYVQPALGPGLVEDRGLRLIVHPPVPVFSAALVEEFIADLVSVVHGHAHRDR